MVLAAYFSSRRHVDLRGAASSFVGRRLEVLVFRFWQADYAMF